MRKTSLTLFLCIALLLIPFALSESIFSDIAEYKGGGVLWRERARVRALISELNVAYLDFDMPYLVTGEQAEWRVNATGGDGVYTYAFYLYYTPQYGSIYFSGAAVRPASSDPIFRFTTEKTCGQYMLEIEVSDSMGNKLRWQSQVFDVYSGESDDETTVAGKVRALARECLASAGESDYDRALWLHDWLIYNANYDYSAEPNYYADGVLLRGTGVCQSYAYAYDMLLKEIGMESIYLTGFAGSSSDPNDPGGYHGWNLVKMDGEWYHVDCTWDDPGYGGHENHSYFGLTDEMISKDHSWTRDEKGVVPECTSTDLTYVLVEGYIPVNDAESLALCLNEMAESGYTYGDFVYIGSDSAFHLYNEAVRQVGAVYSISGTGTQITVYSYFGNVDFNMSQQLRIIERDITLDEGEEHSLRFSALPAGTNGLGVAWSSSNTSVANVSNGVITAKAAGEAIVSAACQSGRRYEVSVRVMPKNILEIPDGVTSIEAEAFADCESISCVKIPDSVLYIAPDAFSGSPITAIMCNSGSYAEEYASENEIYCIISE